MGSTFKIHFENNSSYIMHNDKKSSSKNQNHIKVYISKAKLNATATRGRPLIEFASPVSACKHGPLDVMLNWLKSIASSKMQELLEAVADRMPSRSVYDKHT